MIVCFGANSSKEQKLGQVLGIAQHPGSACQGSGIVGVCWESRGSFPLLVDSHSSSAIAAWLAVGVLYPVVSSTALYFVGIGTILPQLSSWRVSGAWFWWSLRQVLPNLCLYRLQGVMKVSSSRVPFMPSCIQGLVYII